MILWNGGKVRVSLGIEDMACKSRDLPLFPNSKFCACFTT